MKLRAALTILLLLFAVGVIFSIIGINKTKNNLILEDKELDASETDLPSSVNSLYQNSTNNDEIGELFVAKLVTNNNKEEGEAAKIYDSGVYTYIVNANLPKPDPGKYYEAWLVKENSSDKYFSLGELVNNGENYDLLSITELERSDYNKVIVTRETDLGYIDGNPETVLLTGSF